MRFAIGQLSHETATFSPVATTLESFRGRQWQHGEELAATHRGTRDSLGGIVDAADAAGIEVVGTFATQAQPSATIPIEVYETLEAELLGALEGAGAVDAVCLSLHGAGSAEGIDDIEGRLLGRVRAFVGADVPVVVTLDLHGHVTAEMVASATALLGCHYYPHTDLYERGLEAVELARGVAEGRVPPVVRTARVLAILPPRTTMAPPSSDVNELCFEWERRGLLDCAFFHGFPHTDIEEMGATIVATADGDAALAEEAAAAVAAQLWEWRERFREELPGPAEAVAEAARAAAWPVVLADTSDNPGGGAPGDATHLLRAMLDAGLEGACFGFFYDPETAAAAHAAGEGATFAARLGGKTDRLHGAPIEADATVLRLTDGRVVLSTPMLAGSTVEFGPSALLRIGGIDVIVTSTRSQTLDAEIFALHGIDVTDRRVVALKSHQHFRAGFEHLAASIIRVDAPGVTSTDLSLLPFERVRRPIWPLDA
jgi:microcystin degradation protein MlrC